MKTRIYISKKLKVLFTVLAFVGIGASVSAQSFVLDLQNNPMTFTENQRTVVYNAGNNGEDEGSIHKYSNVVTVSNVTVYALLTILDVDNAFIVNFDDDSQTGSTDRFQPRIGSNSGGGFIVYQLEFFDTADDEPVFLQNYYMTGVDIDGNGTNKEYVEVAGYASYQVDATTQLTISANQNTGRTQFLGRSSSLSGVTFDNTAAFIANFSTPNNVISFALGQTSQNSVRYYSVQFGAPAGSFTTPQVIQNPLPVAVDDVGTPIYGVTGGTAVANVLTNDSYDGGSISLSDVSLSVSSAASHPGVVLNTSTGEVTVAPNTPIGNYTITYQICMNASSNDCDMADVFVEVTGLQTITNYFPANGYGTLAFEDLWPAKGDFDFNDMVIDYQFEIVSDLNNVVDYVEATFIIKAMGATYENGFGFQFDGFQASDIVVTGHSLTESYVSLANNGLENNQTVPTFIVFDNGYNEMQHPGNSIGINTDPLATYVTPDTLRLMIDVINGTYTLNNLEVATFNPFLIVDQNRGVEVHLPDMAPTDLANLQLLGTNQDDSNPSTGRYYKTANNLPWAINIYESFDYPKEKVSIDQAHLEFTNWAGSNGTSKTDWYQDNSGYRNASNIYE